MTKPKASNENAFKLETCPLLGGQKVAGELEQGLCFVVSEANGLVDQTRLN